MKADSFLKLLQEVGFGMVSGVPCSYLTPLINAAIDSPNLPYVNAANEGEAVAIASGAQLAGVPGVAMFQNSGLGNAVSPLTSLNAIFEIPVLLICTWRGQPSGPADEPQHRLMGSKMMDLLASMQIPTRVLPKEPLEVRKTMQMIAHTMHRTRLPFALIVEKGAFEPRELEYPSRRDAIPILAEGRKPSGDAPSGLRRTANTELTRANPDDVLTIIRNVAATQHAAVIATTGFTGRALYNVEDRDNHFYMVGSMGCVSSLALGVAVAKPNQPVIAIDGDGALLMRMGALPSIASQSPENLTHVVLDNGIHESTGGQSTLSDNIDLSMIAIGCGYPEVVDIESLDHLRHQLQSPPGHLRMLVVRTSPRENRQLPRPEITPPEVARRMHAFLSRIESERESHG